MLEAFYHAFNLLISGNTELWGIIQRTLQVSLSATFLSAMLAVPLGAWLAFSPFRGRQGCIVCLNTLMGLPPVVLGLIMYLMLSHNGPLGFLHLLFTPSAMALTQAILALPIIAAISRQHLQPLAERLREFLHALNANNRQTLTILLTEGRTAIATAVLAGFGRAIGEVGAVLIVGGNIAYETRVMTTAIALETSKGNLAIAVALGMVLLGLALVVNVCTGLFSLFMQPRGAPAQQPLEQTPTQPVQTECVLLPSKHRVTPALRFSYVDVILAQRTVLQSIQCTLSPTGCSVLLGHNGAGKSVFLRVGSFLLAQNKGSVQWVDRQNRDAEPPQTAIVFQTPIVLQRSVLANVALPLLLAGESKQESMDNADKILHACQMAHLAKRSACVCSLGEQQQIAMARALVLKPLVVFMDEPTANLDPAANQRIEHLILQMKRAGTKIIMATQHLGQAYRLADEVLMLHQGKLVEQTPANLFFKQPKTREGHAFLQHESL